MDPATVQSLSQVLEIVGRVVLDVRGEEEALRIGNTVDGSVKLEYKHDDDMFIQEVGSLLPSDKNTPIICHWNKGGRAGKAALALQKVGYLNVYNGVNGEHIKSAL